MQGSHLWLDVLKMITHGAAESTPAQTYNSSYFFPLFPIRVSAHNRTVDPEPTISVPENDWYGLTLIAKFLKRERTDGSLPP